MDATHPISGPARPSLPPRAARPVRQAQEDGATAVEYAIFIALIAAVISVTVAAIGGQLLAIFSNPELLGALNP